MPLMPTSQYDTLTAMITPAIFLTANASLIISTSNRMSRVVDRIRVLNDLVDRLGRGTTDLDYAAERVNHLRDQLRRLEWRNERIRYALTTLYIAFTTFVGTSLVLAVDALLKEPAHSPPHHPCGRRRGTPAVRQHQPGARGARGAADQSAGDPVLSRAVRPSPRRYSEPGPERIGRNQAASPELPAMSSRCKLDSMDRIGRLSFVAASRRDTLDEEILVMLTLKRQMQSYGAYHRDPRNKLTHFFGVPLVTFSLFLFLGWFRFVHPEVLPISVATLFYFGVTIYYLRLDWMIALVQLPFTLTLLLLAEWLAQRSMTLSFTAFLVTFVLGWIIQLVGHAMEGKRPALADNILQVFNAPLFLTIEALSMMGFRKANPGRARARGRAGGRSAGRPDRRRPCDDPRREGGRRHSRRQAEGGRDQDDGQHGHADGGMGTDGRHDACQAHDARERNSMASLTCGNGLPSGTGTPRKAQRGSHPWRTS